MKNTIVLPRLVGSRRQARFYLKTFVDFSAMPRTVVIECRNLKTAPASFADELVKQIVAHESVNSIELRSSSDEFASYMYNALANRGKTPKDFLSLKN